MLVLERGNHLNVWLDSILKGLHEHLQVMVYHIDGGLLKHVSYSHKELKWL